MHQEHALAYGMNMPFEFIVTEAVDAVATIRLARAPVNVLHGPMMREISTALDWASSSQDIRTVVITGQGMRVFSAGVEIADHSPEMVEQSIEDFAVLLRKLQDFSLPTIAALNGATLGGGFELATACDMMLSVPDAKIGHPEIKLASIAFFGILMLQRRLPANVITELLAGGEPLLGADAHLLGLVNELVSKENFVVDVARFASQFARMSRPVLQLMMKTLRLARGKSLETGVDEATGLYLSELLPLEDVTEGLSAHAAKRPPAWKHR